MGVQDPETASGQDSAGENTTYKRSGMGTKRATSNWGLNHFRHVLNGDSEVHHHDGNRTKAPEAAKPLILDGDDDGYESAR